MEVVEIPVNKINVRYRFRSPSDLKVNGLVESIKQCGLIHPINIDSQFNLISGYHRLLAHQKLEKETIPSVIRESDKKLSELIELDENIQVNSLNALEYGRHIIRREELFDEMGLIKKRGDNRFTKDDSKLTIEDLASSIGLTRRQYELRKQAAKNLNPEVLELLSASDYANDLVYLVKLSAESEDIQRKVCNLLVSGKTSGWKTAIYQAKIEDFKLKTVSKIDFDVVERFGVPRSIMKFNDAPSPLKDVIDLVNHDENIRHQKSSTRFGLTPQYLHQMNPNQCLFSLDYYTNPNDLILDPFSGRGTTAITSLYLQRRFIGFELNELSNQKSREVIKKHLDVEDDRWNIFDGDGCDMHQLKDEIQIIDAVFTSPPYYSQAESYSDDERDLCNLSIEQFDERIYVMFSNLKRLLKRSDYEKKIFHPAIFTVGTSRKGKLGISDMTHTFQQIAKENGFTFWDQIFINQNNPHLVSSLGRNYEHRYVNKNYESQIAFVQF